MIHQSIISSCPMSIHIKRHLGHSHNDLYLFRSLRRGEHRGREGREVGSKGKGGARGQDIPRRNAYHQRSRRCNQGTTRTGRSLGSPIVGLMSIPRHLHCGRRVSFLSCPSWSGPLWLSADSSERMTQTVLGLKLGQQTARGGEESGT